MSKLYTKDNTSLGDIVYYQESWTGNIIKGEVSEIFEEGCRIKNHYHVNENGKKIEKSYGEGGAKYCDMYSSAQDAYRIKEQKIQSRIAAYCEEIQTMDDLIQFPLHHCLNGEEYTDWEARKAYELRAKELLSLQEYKNNILTR